MEKNQTNATSVTIYASSWARDLSRHLKTHTGEKSIKCNQCDYASSWEGNLRAHMKTHRGEKKNAASVNTLARSQVL